jgi:hypothetical protein
VDVKIERADISVALYQVSPDIGGPALVKRITQCLRKSIEATLLTAPDLELHPDTFAIDIMLAAMSGRHALGIGVGRVACDYAQTPRTPRSALPIGHGGCYFQAHLGYVQTPCSRTFPSRSASSPISIEPGPNIIAKAWSCRTPKRGSVTDSGGNSSTLIAFAPCLNSGQSTANNGGCKRGTGRSTIHRKLDRVDV